VERTENTYRTDHLYLAAFLVCRGHSILATRTEDSRVHFVFAETSQLASDASSFMAGGSVGARQFSFEILKLKRLIPRSSLWRTSIEQVKRDENKTECCPTKNRTD
jgi:Domain of unknown function (DUF5659)